MRKAYQTSVWRSRVYRVNLISKPTISADAHPLHPSPAPTPFSQSYFACPVTLPPGPPPSLSPSFFVSTHPTPCHPHPPPPPFSPPPPPPPPPTPPPSPHP